MPSMLWIFLLFPLASSVPPIDLSHLSLNFQKEMNSTTEIWRDLAADLYKQTWLKLAESNALSIEAQKCLSSATKLLEDVSSSLPNVSDHYAMKLADSWPKLPSGLMRRGPFFLLGDYDECMELIDAKLPVHYTTVVMQIQNKNRTLPLTVGICLPSECNEAAIRQMAKLFFEEAKPKDSFKISEILCQTKEANTWTWIFLGAVLSFLLLLITAGTWMDAKLQREKENEPIVDAEMASDEETVVAQQPVYNAPSIALTFRSVGEIKRIDKATLIDVLCAFSIRISLNHLFRNSTREVSILHGIKVFSAFWIILGHCCLFSLPYMDTVLHMNPEKFSSLLSSLLFNSSLAVDSFLLVAGTVLAYTVRKRILFRGKRGSRNMLLFYFHRVVRLWPALLLFSGFMVYFYSALGDGPLWRQDGIFGAQCRLIDVLSHLAFFSNFTPSLCLPWLWHISLDFQLYLISPIFLFFLSKRSRNLYLGATIAIAISLFYRGFVLLFYNLPVNFFLGMLKENRYEESELSFKLLYGCPLSRCPPFVIGLVIGWKMCLPQKTDLHWLSSLGLKLIGYFCLAFAIFSPFEEGIPAVAHAVFHRTIWAVGLALIIWLAENNQHQYLQYILASPRFLPISRLSFGIYLTHEPILLWLIWTQRQASSASSFSHFVLLAVTVSALSLIAAFFFAICFELPITNIERRLFKKTDCRFKDRSSEKRYLRHGQRRFGAANVLNFTEKTTLWLENVDKPYAGILANDDGQRRNREEEQIQEISSFSEERFIEKIALIKKKKKKTKYCS